MNQLLLTMCIYSSTYNAACQTTLPVVYSSTVKNYIDHEEEYYTKLGDTLLTDYHLKPLTGVFAACGEIYKKDVNLNLTSSVSARYVNSSYLLNWKWSF